MGIGCNQCPHEVNSVKSLMTFQERYQKLNPQQQQAVDTIEGPVIVLAGPGTGKTELIAMRVANILEQTDMQPFNILCLTFTESGVYSMRKRLIEIIGTAAYQVKIHTFHSFCNEVITSYPEKFVFYDELQSVSDVEKVSMYESIFDTLTNASALYSFGNRYLYLWDAMRNIQALKRENISVGSYQEAVHSLQVFFESTGDLFSSLFELKASELDEGIFERVFEKSEFGNRNSGKNSYASRFSNLLSTEWSSYQSTNFESTSEQKKARTALRKKLKNIYTKAEKALPKQIALIEIYEKYQQKLKSTGRYDYEDMIMFVVERFKEDESLLRDYQEQFQFILVDEYQDTNSAQNETVALLASYFESPNVFVVGDDKQSIYRFQGASLENILYFYALYRDQVTVISLQDNYRSHQTILNAAISLIEKNDLRVQDYVDGIVTKLISALEYEERLVDVVETTNPLSEASFIIEQIKKLLAGGVRPDEIAVLYRKHKHVTELAELFEKSGIRYRLDGGENILHDDLIQNLIFVLTYINDPGNSNALFHVLNLGIFDVNRLDLMRLTRFAAKRHTQIIDVMLNGELLDEAKLDQPELVTEVMIQLEQLTHLAHSKNLVTFFDEFLNLTGFVSKVGRQQQRLANLQKLNSFYTHIKQFNAANENSRLADFLNYLEVMKKNGIAIQLQGIKNDDQAVRLMTVHRSKGMEFDYVFMIRSISKNWEKSRDPSKLKLPPSLLKVDAGGADKQDEERRLFFVGLTRAKQHIYITYAGNNEDGKPQTPTLFIAEIDDNYLNYLNYGSDTEGELELLLNTNRELNFKVEEQAWLKDLFSDYQMSVTHLNAYLESPREFFFKYVLRIPMKKAKSLSFGTAVHNALRDFHTAYSQKEAGLPTKKYLLDRFQHHLLGEHMEVDEYKESLEHGKTIMSEYYQHYRSEFHRDSLMEYDFKFHNVMVGDAKITGKLDKVEILDKQAKRVKLIDFKTGNPDSGARELKAPDGKYYRQLVFYKVLAKHSAEFEYNVEQCELEFIEKGRRKKEFIKASVDIRDEDVRAMEKLIQDVYSRITSLEFPDGDGEIAFGEQFGLVNWEEGRD